MHAYRFIIRFEETGDFSREIDVLAGQSFEDFYKVIVEDLKLDSTQWAAFYICDHNFRKKKEILKDTSVDAPISTDEENSPKILLMKDAYLNQFIDDPHQRLMILYDINNKWSFYIEMIRIYEADDNLSYPRIIRSEGNTPNELVPVKIPEITDEDESENDIPDDEIDDEAFYNSDDISDMETEEILPDELDEQIEDTEFRTEELSDDFDEDKA